MSKTILLWFARKALYTAVGAALAALGAYWAQVNPEQFQALTLSGALGAVGAAVFGDLRRAFAADFLQVLAGEDPRKDG